MRSTDGGQTWNPVRLPEASSGTAITALTATGPGFVLAGTTRGDDVIVWSSAKGSTWMASTPRVVGLSGPGGQRINDLSPAGEAVLGVGVTGNQPERHVTLWHPPSP